MHARQILSSLTFRYITKYVTVLSATVFLLLGAFYGYFSYTSFSELSESIVEELETLQLVYQGQSLQGVQLYIDDQVASSAVNRYHYLVTDEAGNKVAGDLSAVPRYREFSDGWLGFEMSLLQWGESIEVDFLARPVQLGGGHRAIVARDYADIVERARLVFRTLFRAMIATLLLGITGGFFSAATTLSRVERLNRELSRVIRGSPGQRLDVESEKGYVGQLAVVMNQMLEQMESLMQGVRRVSDNIAHDLRTPLTRMRNNLSQLRSRFEGREGEDVERIIEDCDELLASFNAVLRISTLESGSRLAGGTEVDLRDLLRDVVELYEPLAHERDITLELDAPQSRIFAGEVDLLFQMFANLLDNAVKYTPNHGRVRLQLGPDPASAGVGHRVVVSDTGPGIAAHERKNVFRRFYRVEASRSEHAGHGLGLSLVQAIAQYHYGAVELANGDPGLRVTVTLP
ncbi:MAG: HAMP domain-containing sensor histidine kinase [Halioglobus sp.]